MPSPVKDPIPDDDSESWIFSPTKLGFQISDLSLGLLMKTNPGQLLQILEDNLKDILTENPELEGHVDPIPLFPGDLSLKDLNDFYGMMECEIFSNYINLFLNLPLFGRRMTYQTDYRKFSLDPPIKRRRFRIDHGMVTSWIVVNRLPYFMKSSLYLEYRFSYELLHDLSFDGKSLHLVLELKGPIGVNRFRIFLNSRDLAMLISFWMDCERFHLHSDDKSRREAFNAIEILYLKHGSRFALPEVVRKGIISRLEVDPVPSIVQVMVHGVPLLERIKKKEVHKIKNFEVVGFLLKTAQEEVMTFLRNYWMPRYFTRNGSPYTDNKSCSSSKVKSHLIWGIEHKAPAPEPVKMTGFSGQAPDDFETLGERIMMQQSHLSHGMSHLSLGMSYLDLSHGMSHLSHGMSHLSLGMSHLSHGRASGSEASSIWNLDLSKKGANAKRKSKKSLKKYTLFEQARKKSMMVPRNSIFPDKRQSLLGSGTDVDYRKSIGSAQAQFGSGYPLLDPLGVDFGKNGRDSFTPSPVPVLNVLRRISRAKTLTPTGTSPSVSKTPTSRINSPGSSPELKLPSIGVNRAAESPTLSADDEESDEEDIVLELPKISKADDKGQISLLPTLTKRISPHKQVRDMSSLSLRSNAISISVSPLPETVEEVDTWDPYLLLELVNPELLTRPTTDQLNTRKWVLGALAASNLAGNPLKDYLSVFSYTRNTPSERLVSEDGEDNNRTDQMEVALNNLDCWQRIERVRSTSGTSHAGRRAEEITNAGGWGGLACPRLLPNFHFYLASLSGDLLEAHLEPYVELKFIVKHYLSSPDKLGLDFEVMVILREMLKSRSVNDSWFALLQEHNFTVLREHVLKYFVWDDRRMLVNCAPEKHTCKHRVVQTSLSACTLDRNALSEEVERDLTDQFIFAPRSEQVWLSLYALEVSGYRPAEVYFPPMPTTTKTVGCSCDEDSCCYEKFGSIDTRDKGARPKSIMMTESQADLPTLADCRSSPTKKRQKLIKPSVINKVDSRSSSIFSGMSQHSMSSRRGSNCSVMSGKGRHGKPYPSSFKQVLADHSSFTMFMKFLEMNLADESEAPLINFWHQIEIMKSYTNFKARKEKAFSIHRKYLYTGNSNSVMKNYLKANAEVCPNLIDISERKNITPNMMINAQTFVCKLLEDRWWSAYKGAWADEKSARTILSATDTETPNANINYGKDYRAHIRYLWGNFTFDLINFQRGLDNKTVLRQFKSFLKKTASKLKELKGRRSKEHGVATTINGINVFVDRLESDVEFFTEINKWISMKCAMSHGKRGKLDRQSEILLVKKADAIVSCYLRSCVPPKISVNLPQRIIDDIDKRLDDSKKFNRCLFYHAVLHMITILLPFWKKFCFVLSARGSSKDQSLIQTVSGHAISQASVLQQLSSESEKEYEKMNRHIDRVKRGVREDIKGLGKKLDNPFKRRDAVLAHCTSVENTVQGSAGRVVCQFTLSEGRCHVKHESGLEVPHPCETLLNCWDDQVQYLLSPLPRVKSRAGTPPGKRGKETAAPLKPLKT